MNNLKEVMMAMCDALRKMGDACDNYENEKYEDAYRDAMQSAFNAMYALNVFVNDYPYGANSFNESRRIMNELETLRDNYDTYVNDDELF